jgi:hypothetical protein
MSFFILGKGLRTKIKVSGSGVKELRSLRVWEFSRSMEI